jgi:4-amino-4-deoxy-L-arabinose transferase-like glycosyltransferase
MPSERVTTPASPGAWIGGAPATGRDTWPGAGSRPTLWLLIVCVASLPLFFWDLQHPGFAAHEGRYAEVAREMLLTGDWITPHLNGEVFLNKPPLMYWLTALVFHVLGLSETARLISGVAALGTMLVLYDLGRRLWRPAAGTWTAAVYLTALVTTAEARQLRPDSLLTLCVCVSIWGAVRIHRGLDGRRGTSPAGLAALWGGVALGIMTKGLVGLLYPALILGSALVLAGRFGEARRYRPGWGLAIVAAVTVPWHAAAGVANPGFGWDYLVNQHLLFFLDRKFPRDSIPDPLWFAWGMLAVRLLPWLVLLPTALARQIRIARRLPSLTTWLPLTWLGTVWLVPSLSPARLEHYFIPVVPAAALLVGALCDDWSRRATSTTHPGLLAERGPAVEFLVLAIVASVGLVLAPPVLRAAGLPTLVAPASVAGLVLAASSGAAAWLARVRRRALAASVIVASGLVVNGVALLVLARLEPLISPRPLIAGIDPGLLAESKVAYEAGEEYQLCAVLDFYLRRHMLLLEPPGFIPPTYLDRQVERLFVKRDAFWEEWRRGQRRFLLFSDPEKPLNRFDQFPQPAFEVGRDARWMVLTNKPPGQDMRAMSDPAP